MNAAIAFRRALVYGLVVAVAVGAVGALVGGLVVGPAGVASALIAAALGAVLTALTAGSLLFGARLVRNDPGNPLYFAVVLGSWLVKFVIFIAVVITLRDQDLVHPIAIFVCLVVVVVGGVIADVVAVLRSRIPYVDPPAVPPARDVP